jgi:hypothetical protein
MMVDLDPYLDLRKVAGMAFAAAGGND